MEPGQLLQVGVMFVQPGQTQQLVSSIAIGSEAMIVTIGIRFVGGGSGGRMAMFTGSLTEERPPLSVALAVSAYVPAGELVQTMKKIFVGHSKPAKLVRQGRLLPNPKL